MKITVISVTDKGGAGYASKNLYQGLCNIGVDASYLTMADVYQKSKTSLPGLYNWWLIRKNINRNYSYIKDAPPGYDYFTFARTGYHHIHEHPAVKNADVLNIHWVTNMIDYPSFFKNINKPIIWTLHDANPFTGGCHYTFGCDHFLTDCSDCPQLSARVKHFAARDNLALKQGSLSGFAAEKSAVISPSVWLKNLSLKSSLFKKYRHYHISNGVETQFFKYHDKLDSRSKMNLPADKFIILFIGTSLAEHRKGFDAILKLAAMLKPDSNIIFAAAGKSTEIYEGVTNLGYLADKDQIAAAYSAADVFLIPSREDNLPNTMLEALCCGTPVIGFKTGGIVDAIIPGQNGFIVEQEDLPAIVEHIGHIRDKQIEFDRQEIARLAGKKYLLEIQAAAYQAVAEDILN